MTCSILGCDKTATIIVSLLGVRFGYCKNHKRYSVMLMRRQNKHRTYKHFGVYELNATH